MDVFREMQGAGEGCTTSMCAILVHVFSEAAAPMLDEANAVFAAVRDTGGVPDESAWSALVKLHCKWGKATEALARVDEMAAAGVAPRLRSYAPILSLACSRGDQELARLVLSRLEECALPLGVSEHVDLVRLAHRTGGADAVAAALRKMAGSGALLNDGQVAALKSTFAPPDGAAAAEGAADGDGAGDGTWRVADCVTDQGACARARG